MSLLNRLFPPLATPDDEGQGVIEYVLVAGVISMALYAAFATTGITTEIANVVGSIVTTMGG